MQRVPIVFVHLFALDWTMKYNQFDHFLVETRVCAVDFSLFLDDKIKTIKEKCH